MRQVNAWRSALQTILDRVKANYGPLRRHLRPHSFSKFVDGLAFPALVDHLDRLFRTMADHVGDGRCTALLIAASIVDAALSKLEAVEQIPQINMGIGQAIRNAATYLETLASEPEDAVVFLRAAITAALGDQDLGGKMFDAFRDAGSDGAISIVISPPKALRTIRVTVEEGRRFPLVTVMGPDSQVSVEDSYIVVVAGSVTGDELRGLAQSLHEIDRTGVFLVEALDGQLAEDWAQDADDHQRIIVLSGEKTDRWPDLSKDIAVIAGATILVPHSDDLGNRIRDCLGWADRIGIMRESFTVYGTHGNEDVFEKHIDALRHSIEHAVGSEKEWLAERLARLTEGLVYFEISGESASENDRLYDLACAALQSLRTVLATNVIPGIASTLFRTSRTISAIQVKNANVDRGIQATADGLAAPLEALVGQTAADYESVGNQLLGEADLCFHAPTASVCDSRLQGPIEAMGLAQSAIVEAGAAAIDLLDVFLQEAD